MFDQLWKWNYFFICRSTDQRDEESIIKINDGHNIFIDFFRDNIYRSEFVRIFCFQIIKFLFQQNILVCLIIKNEYYSYLFLWIRQNLPNELIVKRDVCFISDENYIWENVERSIVMNQRIPKRKFLIENKRVNMIVLFAFEITLDEQINMIWFKNVAYWRIRTQNEKSKIDEKEIYKKCNCKQFCQLHSWMIFSNVIKRWKD